MSAGGLFGRRRRARRRLAEGRLRELARLPFATLAQGPETPGDPEVVTDSRGRRYEVATAVEPEGDARIHVLVSVTDLPRRRRVTDDGFVMDRERGMIARTVLLRFYPRA
jgi:hypothetical protein